MSRARSTVPARRGAAMAVLLVAAFMSLLDSTIVNVALPSIHDGLGAAPAQLEWIVSGYSLAFGLVLVPAGRVGDRFGHKWIFCVGMTLFTGFSLACSLATSPGELVAFRVAQGLGAGVFSPAMSATIQTMYTGLPRARAFGWYGTVVGVSTASGPLLGGLIIQAFGADHGWRWVFAVNVPIGVVAVVLGALFLAGSGTGREHGFDPAGTGLLSIALLAVLLPLVEGQSAGWPTWTFMLLGAAPLLLGAFALWERRLARAGGEPLIAPTIVRLRSFSAGAVIAIAYFASFTSVFFVLSMLWQHGLGRSALATGLMIVPWSVGGLVSAPQTSRLVKRLGRATLQIGIALVAASLLATMLIVRWRGLETTAWDLLVPLFIGGVGNGMTISPNQTFTLAEAPAREAGSAGGLLQTCQRVGGAAGIAVVGTVLFSTAQAAMPVQGQALAYVHGAQVALAVNAGLALIAFLLVFSLRNRPAELERDRLSAAS